MYHLQKNIHREDAQQFKSVYPMHIADAPKPHYYKTFVCSQLRVQSQFISFDNIIIGNCLCLSGLSNKVLLVSINIVMASVDKYTMV